MTDDERIKMLETTLARLLQWIAAAESRNSLVLSLNTAMLGTLAASAPRWHDWTVVLTIAAGATLLAIAVSFYNLCKATFPRTNGPGGSMIFFAGIAAQHRDNYPVAITLLDKTGYIKDLAAQCHRNAVIANEKFGFVKRAQIALFAAVLPWSVSLLLVYEARI